MKFVQMIKCLYEFFSKDAFDVEKVETALHRMDTDSNGKITYRELAIEIGNTMTEEHLDTRWYIGLTALICAFIGGLLLWISGH